MKTNAWWLRLIVAVLMGCGAGRPSECTTEIKLLDGGTRTQLGGCAGTGLYDCAKEDAGTTTWNFYCAS